MDKIEPNELEKSIIQADPMAKMDTRMIDNRSAEMANNIDPRYREYR